MMIVVNKFLFIVIGMLLAVAGAILVCRLCLYNTQFSVAFTQYADMVGIADFVSWLQGGTLRSFDVSLGSSAKMLTLVWLLPIAVIALSGQLLGMGSWEYYVPGTAVGFLLVPFFVSSQYSRSYGLFAAYPMLALMGAVAGLIYWGVSGRQANFG